MRSRRGGTAQTSLPREERAVRSASPGAAVPFYVFALFSGAAALVYETAWAKLLALTFGSTTLAAAAVIAAFMGGMGLGAWAYHLLYDRVRHPVVIYAALELGIAVSTAVLTRLFYELPEFFAGLSSTIAPGAGLNLTRFLTVFVLLVVPSALMGATFPALCTVMIRSVRTVDRRLGMIYGINTLGGASGVLLAGLVLIERLGLTSTVNVANVINIAVGLAALALSRSSLSRGDGRAVPAAQALIPTNLPRWITGTVLLVSGFTTLSYEILWFRALRYLAGNSTYALTAVLGVFLAGLGLGSLLLERITRRRSAEADLALCQCLIAVLALVAMACASLILSLPVLRDHVSIYVGAVQARPWASRLLVDGAVAVVVMLPATLFMGLSFPLASRLFLGDVRKLGTRVGGAYLLANLGGILGSVAGALVLLPLFGTIGGTKVVALINLALGVLVGLWVHKRAFRGLLPAFVAVVSVLALACLLPQALILRGEKIDGVPGQTVFSEEGDLATVQVLAKPGNPAKKAMTIDGHQIGWSVAYGKHPFYRKQLLLAHLPMVLDSRIRHTLNIGLGSASTLHTLASYPEVETLDCVEISAAVVRASGFFDTSVILEDPRTNLIVDDALHYLLRSPKKYDAIISDGKQHPFFSGNATLLCREFYRFALDDLSDDGLFVQWIPLGTLSSDFRVILRTACEVFPYLEVFYFPRFSVMLVGSRRPLAGRPGLSEERYRSLPISRDLAPYLIDHPTAMRSRWTGSRRQLLQILGTTSISTWDRLLLDFSAFKAPTEEWEQSQLANLRLLVEAGALLPSGAARTFDPGESPYVESWKLLRRAWVEYFAGRMDQARALAEQAVERNPGDRAAKVVLAGLRRSE